MSQLLLSSLPLSPFSFFLPSFSSFPLPSLPCALYKVKLNIFWDGNIFNWSLRSPGKMLSLHGLRLRANFSHYQSQHLKSINSKSLVPCSHEVMDKELDPGPSVPSRSPGPGYIHHQTLALTLLFLVLPPYPPGPCFQHSWPQQVFLGYVLHFSSIFWYSTKGWHTRDQIDRDMAVDSNSILVFQWQVCCLVLTHIQNKNWVEYQMIFWWGLL